MITAEERECLQILTERPDVLRLLRATEGLDSVEVNAVLVGMKAFQQGADNITALRKVIAYLTEHGKPETAQRLTEKCLEPMIAEA